MPIALDADLRALADSVGGLARRHAPMEETRARFDDLTAGGRPPVWDHLVGQGLHALHLPEHAGGADAGLAELAVVAEQSGRCLLPGPWLPTVLASAVLTALDPKHAALEQFAEGASGAVVTEGLTAIQDGGPDGGPGGEHWRLSGTSSPALGLPGAELVLVGARVEDGSRLWFVLDSSHLDGQVDTAEALDLTRSLGRLRGDGLVLAAEAALSDDDIRIDLITTTLYAAEAAGLAAWAVETAVAYVKTRVQFGQPVGSFQAVQHKAAMMLVRSEIAAAAAWDAARADTQDAAQQGLAASQAALNAVLPTVEVVLELVTLLGGIGFTWEHDAHLYWRRAIALASLVGTADERACELGSRAERDARDFTFLSHDELPDLRQEIAPILDRVAAATGDASAELWLRVRPGETTDLLADAGLIAPQYPAPWGRGAGIEEQAVVADEYERRGLVRPSTVIGEWVLPTLLSHGSAEQQERFIDPTLRGEIFWCQLFSEPGAGSDLASLSTRATKVDGGWRLQGQKVWTSGAHEADWGVCLARTDAEVPKHKGISYFLIDMTSPGVDVRPLLQATGRSEFNEVFLDDVFVPDECLVGEREQGWKLAVTTLGNERLSMGARLTHGGSDRFRGLIDNPAYDATRDAVRRAYGRCTAREIALSALNLRGILARLSGQEIGAAVSVQKVFNCLAQREGSLDLLSVLGPVGASTEGYYSLDHIGLPAVLFGGGTPEIQLNVIAQRVLGLPR